MRRALLIGTALALGACGGEASDAPVQRSDRLVDFSKKPPFVNSLERDGGTGELLLTTNRGFFRIDPDSGAVRRQRATIDVGGRRAALGTFLEVDLEPGGELAGSGHPDPGSRLPQYLGYLRSDDGGRKWRVVSRLGRADLHKLVFRHDRLYAWDAVLGALIISEDGGRRFSEHFTPRGVIIDFEVDPRDPDRILAATDEQLFRSTDGGDSWRPVLRELGVRLSWPEAERLYVATKDGRVQISRDGGDSFAEVGEVEGEPYVLEPVTADDVYLALSDGTVLRTVDGGEGWKAVFRP